MSPRTARSSFALRAAFPAGLFAAAFALYFATLCPGVYPGDSGELIAAAWSLGVPHPTGYPLFMTLGWLLARLLPGSPAFAMNTACALFGALACLGAYRLNREIWRHMIGRSAAGAASFRFLAAAGALLLGASATWWSQSNQTEVYALMLVFLAFAWTAGLRTIRKPTARGLRGLAALSGFAFLHHQLFLVTLPLSLCALIAFWKRGRDAERGRAVALAALLFLAPLAGYLYLPLRAAAEPPVNWGDPADFRGVVRHVAGSQYAGTRILTRPSGLPIPAGELGAHFARRGGEIVEWLGEQILAPRAEDPDHTGPPEAADRAAGPLFGVVALALAGLGVYCLQRTSRLAAAGLAAGAALNLAVVMLYTIPDIEAYQLPLWTLVVALGLAGPVRIKAFLRGSDGAKTGTPRKRAWAAGGVALVLAASAVAGWWDEGRGVNKRAAVAPGAYVRDLTAFLPENAVVLTSGDYDIFPLWYGQVCEERRPDVAVVGANFVFNAWYRATLRATLPEGFKVYVGDEPPSTQQRWLVAVLGGVVAPALEAGLPVFLTFLEGDPNPALIAGRFALEPVRQYPHLTPEGETPRLIVWRLTDPDGFAPEAAAFFRKTFPDWREHMVGAQ